MRSPSRSPEWSPPPPPSPPPCPWEGRTRSPSSSYAQPRWSCTRCTFSNCGGFPACGICDALRHPVDDELAWSLPLRRSARKRERAGSPDVVEVCNLADEADGAAAAENGKSETHLDKKTFKIMTYNVWFREDIELNRRMDALGELIKQHNPDLICFQEVTPYIYLLLQKSYWWQKYKCLLSHDMAIERPYYCMQMSKLPVQSSDHIPFSRSVMGRGLCIATVKTALVNNLVLATTQLESPCPVPPLWDQIHSKERLFQANESLRILGGFRNAILCGDMNWDDERDGPFPLPEGWVDAWAELKPGDNGWTYDTKANGMLSNDRSQQKRLDRFVCKLLDFNIHAIEMIGKEAIPGVSHFTEKIAGEEVHKMQLPVLPSDHFGLVLTITRHDDTF